MNIINLEHINKIYGEKVIFDDASFGIQERDKIGIVGINGTGKSTLLKVIAGEEVPDSGQVIRQNGLKLAFVPQNPVFPDGADIRSYALESGTDESWQVESNLTELGITDFDQKIEQLSGGQKRRVVLAKILAGNFDVLLLDEPTNHLDQEMIIWLEEYLRSYRGTVLMVTHDRYFLDRILRRIFAFEGNGKIRLEIYNAYGDTSKDAPIDAAGFSFDDALSVTFTVSGTGMGDAAADDNAADAATVDAAAPADNAADANKGNPETGVAGVAVAAGVVALAGAAVVASRKRK